MKDYNKIRDVRIGLICFEVHGGTECDAQHDILYAGQKDGVALSPDEIGMLYAAGWFHPSESCQGCAEEDDVDVHFDPDDKNEETRAVHKNTCTEWAIFT